METLKKIIDGKSITNVEAQQLFDTLESVSIDFMIGKWKGEEIFTEHPMDGFLASTGWYGKIFKSADEVHPLLFYTDKNKSDIFAVNPSTILDFQSKSADQQFFLADYRSEIETKEYKARLRNTEFRESISATMIYDQLPINDVFKKIDDNTLLGAMDMRDDSKNYFFILRRDFN